MGERSFVFAIVVAVITFLLMIGPNSCGDGRAPDIETRQSPT